MATLRVKSGPLAGQAIEVKAKLTIGRLDADLTIDDEGVAQRHAEVRVVPGGLELVDLGSSSGTFVDGKRITEPTLVGGGSQLRVGATVLEVEGALRARSSDSRPIRDPEGATMVRQVPPEMRARPGATPAEDSSRPLGASTSSLPASGGPPSSGESASKTPVGVFSPPTRKHTRGLASRSWIPVILSFGTVILTALALIIYFAAKFG